MKKQPPPPRRLRLEELEAVYAISRAVAETLDFDKALAAIVSLARPVFIFDNAVLYLVNDQGGLEPTFARAIGRGRSSEADSAWGEMAANEAFSSATNFVYQPEIDPKLNRIEQRFYLGIPLLMGGECRGALVFIRFGGPAFTDKQINLAEFIAAHVIQVLEHKRLVERIGSLEAERRLVQLQSDFVANVSHEFKTPLGFIKGYSTTLLREDTQWDYPERREFLGIIDEEADRLTEMVDNLLDSSRLQSRTLDIAFETVDLVSLLEENIERLRQRYPDLDIQWEDGASDCIVNADPKRLSQVIDNLVGNATKYAPGSSIGIKLKQTSRKVAISVSDSGPGIDPSETSHIFRRFYRSASQKDKVRGSGLGLYICNEIVKAHSGEIRVKSKKGKGAEFVVTLPKQDEHQPV